MARTRTTIRAVFIRFYFPHDASGATTVRRHRI
jgi:hypothetical protein